MDADVDAPAPAATQPEPRGRSLWREIGGWLLVVLGGLVVAALCGVLTIGAFLLMLTWGACSDETFSDFAESPDGRYRVTARTTDCGATTGWNTRVRIHDDERGRRSTIVHVAMRGDGIRATWQSDNEVTIVVTVPADKDGNAVPHDVHWRDLIVHIVRVGRSDTSMNVPGSV